MPALPHPGTLSGEHVLLEPLAAEHAGDLSDAAEGDRSTFGWTTVPDGPGAARTYVALLLDQQARGEIAAFVQRRTDTGSIVGATRFLEPRWPLGRPFPDEVEVGGTWLAATAQRTAINTEAKLLLLGHAFEVWGVQRAAICTDARNARSRTAIERIGARLDGVLRRHRPSAVPGEQRVLRDTAVYSVVDEEWPAVRAQLIAASTTRGS
jgi:RimJ/RimL family protein N-acetyltransferase